MAAVSTCPKCGLDPAVSFRDWKRSGGEICTACLDTLRKRLKLTSKRTSIIANAKTVENDVSRYLFDRLRDWKDRHDISDPDGLLRGEVKQAPYESVQARGGVMGILRKAFAQCEDVCDGALPFSVLHIKGTKVETAYVMVRGVVTDLKTFRDWLRGEPAPDLAGIPHIGES